MNITFTGHHIDLTPTLKEQATKKFRHLQNTGVNITHMAVTFTVEKLNHIVKVILHIKGHEIHASESSPDMYAAIDKVVDKLNRQIKKHREEAKEHR